MWRYADFLKIRRDFIDVYSEEEDRKHPSAWQVFVPHRIFRSLLKNLISVCKREETDIKPIWIYGPYGTGKTYACFVLKHLFEDPLSEVETYFRRHPLLQDLKEEFWALRERGPWVVVYRSAASFVSSAKILLASVQESVREALRGKGFKIPQTHKEEVVAYLKEHPNVWRDLFERHRYTVFSAFDSQETVLKFLDSSSKEALSLLSRLEHLLEEENILLHSSPEDLKKWLEEVIVLNNLAGLIFIWDEFTDFFQASAPVSDLQELAHAAKKIPFYFIPVTHVSPELIKHRVTTDDKTMEKLFDRYHRIYFKLQPVTAYELAGNVLEVDQEREEEWDEKRDLLWEKISRIVSELLENETEVKESHLKKLVPIHPYTAYLLAEISKEHSSSQRSLFKFLKAEKGLAGFIERFPKDNRKYWLTADLLWDYFFEEGSTAELPEQARNTVNYAHSRLLNLEDPETRRVFKIIMFQRLLYDLSHADLLAPETRNLRLALPEEELTKPLTEHIAYLKEKGVVNPSPKGHENEEYLIPIYGYDVKEMENLERKKREEWPFCRVVSEELSPLLEKLIEVEEYLFPRFLFKAVSVEDLSKYRENVVEKEARPYQVPVVAVVSLSEEKRKRGVELARQCAEREERTIFLVISPIFGEEEYTRWVQHKAKEEWALSKGHLQNAEYHKREAEKLLRDWCEMTRYRDLFCFWQSRIKSLRWASFRLFYSEITEEIFPYSPEKIYNSPATLFKNFKEVKKPLEIGLGLKRPDKQYENLISRLEALARREPAEREPFYEIQKRVREWVRRARRVRVVDLWRALEGRPFGFHPAPVSKAIFAFVMKEFGGRNYYYWDGVRSFPLSREGLRDLLETVLRGKKQAEEYELRLSSPEAEDLAKRLQSAFRLSSEELLYLESLRNRIREKIREIGFPLWSLKYLEPEPGKRWKAFISLLQWWLREKEVASEISLAEETDLEFQKILEEILERVDIEPEKGVKALYRLTKEDLPEILAENFFPQKLEKAFKRFLDKNNHELYSFVVRGETDCLLILKHLQRLVQEEVVFWQEEQVKRLLSEVLAELKISKYLREITDLYHTKFLYDLLEEVAENFLPKKLRISLFFWGDFQEDLELKETVHLLGTFLKYKKLEAEQKIKLASYLEKNYFAFRKGVKEIPSFVTKWVKTHTGFEISKEELEELLNTCASLVLEEDREKVAQMITAKCQNFERVKLFKILQEEWEKETKSRSPREWSEKELVPIRWLFEGKEFHAFFDLLDRSSANEVELSELKEFQNFLRKNQHIFNLLWQKDEINKKFVRKLFGEDKLFKNLDQDFLESLKHYLKKESRLAVDDWAFHEEAIKELAQRFLDEHYDLRIKERVLSALERKGEREIKNLLRRLVEDPRVGLKVLEWL